MATPLNIPPRIRGPFLWKMWLGLSLVAITGAAVLFLIDPARQSLFPQCLFHQLTGWWCIGCGGTRAMHQVLHGHVATAFFLNPLFVLAMPVAAYWLLRLAIFQMTGRELPFVRWHWAWGAGLTLLVIFFFIARNVAIPGFGWLRL